MLLISLRRMEQKVIFELISCVGMHWIFKYGSILNIPRNLIRKIALIDNLFKCSLCLGFWVGLIVMVVSGGNILLPFASAGVCWFFDNINNTLQSVEIKLDK